MSGSEPRSGSTMLPLVALGISLAASIGLAVVYVLGGNSQWEGALLGLSLGGIGTGLILWAKRFMPVGRDVQEREPLASTEQARERAEESFEQGAEIVTRRKMLLRMLGGALAAMGIAALFPIRSLGRAPRGALFHTEWKAGLRAVDVNGDPVRAGEVLPGNVITAFPEGFVGSADSQTLLIGLEPGLYHPLPGREDWAPDGVVGYSKVCTHAGCPVGLYQADAHELFCPCHQSVFDVSQGAAPRGGPAPRPLPQLPLAVDDQGYIVAQGDFSAPIGPGFWELPRG